MDPEQNNTPFGVVSDIYMVLICFLTPVQQVKLLLSNRYHKKILSSKFLSDISRLISKYGSFSSIHDLIIAACKFDLLCVVTELTNQESSQKHLYRDYFATCCENGSINVAKFLYAMQNQSINIEFPDYSVEFDIGDDFDDLCYSPRDSAFVVCCKNGYLEFAQWIFSIMSDHIMDTTNIATLADRVKNAGHINVANWLITLDNQ